MLDWQIPINEVHEKHCLNIEKCDSNTVLYHYTSPAGLLGIFNSSELWFSDSDFLNDSSESDYFHDTVKPIRSLGRYVKRIASGSMRRCFRIIIQVLIRVHV